MSDLSNGTRARVATLACLGVLLGAVLGAPVEAGSRGVKSDAAGATRWVELRSANFLLAGEVEERDLRDVARRLEEFREALLRLLPTARFATKPTVVLVFPHRRAYRPFAPLFNDKPIDAAGFFQPGPDVNYVTIVLREGASAYPIVFHEFAHLFVGANLGSVPVWFGEGLAEYYSTFQVSSDGKTAKVGRLVDRHVFLLRDRFIPLADVLAANHLSPLYNQSKDRDVFYAESWALVHYLLLGAPARTAQLFQFLQRLDAATAPEQACREAFGVSMAMLESDLRQYVRHLAFPSTLVTFNEPIALRTGGRTERLGEAAVEARLGDLLLHMNRQSEADVRLANALRLDPDQLLAHLSLGELRIRQQRAPEGLKLLERATTIHPDSLEAQLAYGRTVLQRANTMAPEQIAAARRAFARALEIAPDSPEALAGVAWALSSEGERLDEARRLAERAVQLDWTEPNHVLLLVQVLARQGDLKGARQRLGPLMASSRLDVRERARMVMGILAEAEERANARPVPANAPTDAAVPASGSYKAYQLALRDVREGEQRAFGSLERIECAAGRIVFHVKTTARVLRLSATRLQAVQFISYRDDLKGSVGCGVRQPPDPVYATWRPGTGKFEGEAIAFEFVPKDYRPGGR